MKITAKGNNIIITKRLSNGTIHTIRLVTLKSRTQTMGAMKWLGKFGTCEGAGIALIEYCNKQGLSHGQVIPEEFGELSGLNAGYINV